MAMPFGHEDMMKLKKFIDFIMAHPTVLNMPELEMVKNLIESFGGKVPPGEFTMPVGGKCPFGGDGSAGGMKAEPKAAEVEEEDSESEVELDMEGVIEPDTDANQPMGDTDKSPTEEEVDQASDIRSQAASAYSEQKYQEAIDLYTNAIELNPGNALFHAKRGQAFLKLQKPNACIRDCEKALQLNCDSAAAYKFRGRAHRLLGNWEAAAKDLRQACKLDFDEEADEWLREVTPNAKKIEQHRIKQERKALERARKQREAANKARSEATKQQQNAEADSGLGGFPGGGGAGGFDFLNDVESIRKDPEVMAFLDDICKNPDNIEKYKQNPKLAKLIALTESSMKGFRGFPGGFPGFPGGFPGGAAAADATDTNATATAPPTESETAKDAKPQPKKPDFVDDGLD